MAYDNRGKYPNAARPFSDGGSNRSFWDSARNKYPNAARPINGGEETSSFLDKQRQRYPNAARPMVTDDNGQEQSLLGGRNRNSTFGNADFLRDRTSFSPDYSNAARPLQPAEQAQQSTQEPIGFFSVNGQRKKRQQQFGLQQGNQFMGQLPQFGSATQNSMARNMLLNIFQRGNYGIL